MNISSIILACTALGLGTAGVYLYTELDAERARANAEAALRRDQEARVQALEARLAMQVPPEMLMAGPGEATATSGSEGKGKSAAAHTPEGNVVTEAEPGRRIFPGMRSALRDMLGTPEGREMMLNRQKMGLRMQYKDLAKELNLSAEQADKLMTLLAEQQVRQLEKFQQGDGDRGALQQTLTEMQRQNETELMTLLGDKYLQYEDYQKSVNERMQLEQMNVQFDAVNLALNDSQKKQLLSAMVQAREAAPRPTWTQGTVPEQFMEQQRVWQKDYNERVKEQAAGVLTPQQLKQFEEMQQSQGAMTFAMPGMRANGAVVRGMRPLPRQQ